MTVPTLVLNTQTFLSNIAAVRERIAPSELMLVLKDDAYGHGLGWAVPAAARAGVRWFGSFDIPSGVQARQLLGEHGRIFAWVTSTDEEIDAALAHGIDLGVGSAEYLTRVIARAADAGVRARIHLKIDTGLHRNGFLAAQWQQAVTETRQAEQDGHAELVGVWSHLAEASDDEDDDAQRIFHEALQVVEATGPAPEMVHLTASAASWWRPELRGNLSRIGAFCYGVRSADGPDLEGVLPAAELVATVTAVSDDGATINIGAFDGIPSSLVGAVAGTPAGPREITRIDEMTSRVAPWPAMTIGDHVWICGAGHHGESSATTLAERIDTVGEEVLTRLTPRVARVVVETP